MDCASPLIAAADFRHSSLDVPVYPRLAGYPEDLLIALLKKSPAEVWRMLELTKDAMVGPVLAVHVEAWGTCPRGNVWRSPIPNVIADMTGISVHGEHPSQCARVHTLRVPVRPLCGPVCVLAV